MAGNNGLTVKTKVSLLDPTINGQLINGKQKTLNEEAHLQPKHETVQVWVKLLKDIWIGEEEKTIKQELCRSVLDEIFDKCENPMKIALVLHKLCPDYGAQKTTSLAGFVLRHLEYWLQKAERNNELYKRLDRDLKIEAFVVGTNIHTTHLELIISLYKLKSDDMADYILQTVKDMVAVANYRNAISCATLFGLQSHFTLIELVIPCMLQDRFVAVDAFIKNERKMQEELVRYFDNLIGLDERTINHLYDDFRKRKIMTIPISKLQKKAIEKLVAKLLATYNLSPQEVAPKLSRSRRESALRHIAFTYFIERSITEEGYFDYVAQALQFDLALQKYFINYLCSNGWFNDAVRWVVLYNMIDCAPCSLQPYLCRNTILMAQTDLARIISERASVANVELFPGHPIKIIATPEDLERLYPVIEEADLIGIDTEWKPLFMCTSERKAFQVALFQVCVQRCSYLVDVVTLENILTEEHWKRFFRALFSDSNAIKLGFDFLNDLKMLHTSFPYLQPLEEMKNVICMLKLVKNLLSSNPAFLDLGHSTSLALSNETKNLSDPVSDETMHFRLTDLCQKVLGQALDKTEQIGNWAMRPLRREQIKYAAMDGYCLLNLYDKLKIRAEREYNMDWTKHCKESDITEIKSKEEKRVKKKGAKFDDKEFEQMIERVNSGLNNLQMKRKPKDLKVIVDSMMLGLGKHLRRCGIDTILAETRSYLIEYAERDPNRYIISCGRAVDELRRHRSLRGTQRILSVPTTQNMNIVQQIEFILRQFNMHLSKDDIFSRCMKCNSTAFVIAPSPVLEAMYQANVVASNPFSEEVYDVAKYNEKMREVDAAMYSGYGCDLEVSKNDRSWIIAHCHNGILDVENCAVAAVGCDTPTEVRIEKVPLQVLEKKGRFFYVCGACGTVYWDGCHVINYNTFVGPLLAEEKISNGI
uniref:3'-5' exonuclease domain-containing protein n=1 Tax=Elaeophora elaphi TaxID=1147741 RepID=A0A0R3RS08_9BILA